MISIVDKSEDAESEDDHEASDADQENNLGVNIETDVKASCLQDILCVQIYAFVEWWLHVSFHDHLGQKISEGEIENLSNKKWEYKWEVPAFDMSNCKWIGTGKCFLKGVDIDSNYGVKQRLFKHWLDDYKISGGNDFHSSKQRLFFSLCNSYRDILHCNKKPFYLKGLEEDSSIMDAYIMHSVCTNALVLYRFDLLNHVFRTRDLIRKNDSKMEKHQESAGDESLTVDGFLDHGFTRPKYQDH
ncbi:hypothetical protein GH714_004486 [Hevea brasiliensis]|uniref:UTP25 NTP hydrolase-like domain-containing protein n=1 Tax=Hevea brasiliensis TaxID=3981 RepID=A0A6A6MAY5_HEVBR|nr:hypothetical protein GH714_004486 [Hevea brasiliensis]